MATSIPQTNSSHTDSITAKPPVNLGTPAVDAAVAPVAYADGQKVMESARRMLQIHRETFRKLAD